MKILNYNIEDDRIRVMLFNFPIYYRRNLEKIIRHRFLCFRWETPCSQESILLNKIYKKLENLEQSNFSSENIKKSKFPFETIRNNTVLLIETNNFHSELLPGIARYFVDLGYNVDILLSYYESKLNPFSRYLFKKIRIKPIDGFNIQDVLKDNRIKQYSYIYFNSDKVNYQKNTAWDYFSELDYPENRKIYMLHHPDSSRYEGEAKTCMLGDFEFINQRPEIIVPTYFGNVDIYPKNKKTKFIVVGNIERKRKNFDLLLKTVENLISKKISNFEINVVSRQGEINIPNELKLFINFKGKLSYEEMYREVENSDFLLALLDHEIEEHLRYLNKGISGSFLLSWGFRKPCILDSYFANQYGFNNKNSILYSENNKFEAALIKAINIDSKEYLKMQLELSEETMDISAKSKSALQRFVQNLRKE